MATNYADNVVNGPSREQLFDALRLYNEKRIVRFIWVAPDDKRPERIDSNVFVTGISVDQTRPDGLNWEIEGYEKDCETANGLAMVRILFNTMSRTGRLDFVV